VHNAVIVTILGGLAEFERSLIRARAGEGRERTKRTAAEAHSAPEAGGGRAFKAGEAVMEIARTFGVDRATIYSPE
jgi:DNA invertase Pin-like site-specific DNA recombinase